jgi:hypothetical protein
MPADPTAQAVPQATIPELIAGLGAIFGEQVTIDLLPALDARAPSRAAADFIVRVTWMGEPYEFAAEAKARNTPRVLEEAIRQSRRLAAASGRLPMVIVPFLGESRIDLLAQEGVSGLDLCGNGLVVVPGRMVLRRTGQPNRYPESRPARFAYRGATSQVPRAFLRRTEYDSVNAVRDEIELAGGSVALSTVSKALARMAEDLIIDRSADRICLLQPDKLIDALANDFVPPKPERTARAKTPLSLADFFRVVEQSRPPGSRPCIALSGASSQDRYAAGMREDVPVVYAKNLDDIRQSLGEAWQPTDRFATLTIIETRDPTPFFDARVDQQGVRYASPVQTFLELARGGEKRDEVMAQQVRRRILETLRR